LLPIGIVYIYMYSSLPFFSLSFSPYARYGFPPPPLPTSSQMNPPPRSVGNALLSFSFPLSCVSPPPKRRSFRTTEGESPTFFFFFHARLVFSPPLLLRCQNQSSSFNLSDCLSLLLPLSFFLVIDQCKTSPFPSLGESLPC